MKLFKNKHGHDEGDKYIMRLYGSINALKHINNLSDKQRPVFDELEENFDNVDEWYSKHKNETAHYDVYDIIWLLVKWIGGIAAFLALTKPLWDKYI